VFIGFAAGGGYTLLLYVLLSAPGFIDITLWQALHKVVGAAAPGAAATPVIFRICVRLHEWMGLSLRLETSWHELP